MFTADCTDDAVLAAETWLYAVRSPSFGSDLAQRSDRVVEALARLVASERDGREEWALSDAEVATVMICMFNGVVQQRRLRTGRVPDDLYGRALTALLRGLDRD